MHYLSFFLYSLSGSLPEIDWLWCAAAEFPDTCVRRECSSSARPAKEHSFRREGPNPSTASGFASSVILFWMVRLLPPLSRWRRASARSSPPLFQFSSTFLTWQDLGRPYCPCPPPWTFNPFPHLPLLTCIPSRAVPRSLGQESPTLLLKALTNLVSPFHFRRWMLSRYVFIPWCYYAVPGLVFSFHFERHLSRLLSVLPPGHIRSFTAFCFGSRPACFEPHPVPDPPQLLIPAVSPSYPPCARRAGTLLLLPSSSLLKQKPPDPFRFPLLYCPARP